MLNAKKLSHFLNPKQMEASTTNIKYRKQKWGPNSTENGLFVQSGLIQRLEGERGELRQSILFTNKHGLVRKEPPDSQVKEHSSKASQYNHRRPRRFNPKAGIHMLMDDGKLL